MFGRFSIPSSPPWHFKLSACLALLLFMSGCARPRYVREDNSANPQSTAQENKANCHVTFQNSGFCLLWYWEKQPTSKEAGSLIFKTYRLNILDETPIEMDTTSVPQLILWMPGMGHGSTPTQTERIDVGTYRSSSVFFIMPGEWELKFQIKEQNMVVDEAKTDITL